MLGLGNHQKFYLYTNSTDMRKSFDSLSGLVRNTMGQNPMDGSVYVFLNKRRNLIKLLQWDKSGFALYCKRLEQGGYEKPKTSKSYPQSDQVDTLQMQLTWAELMLILEGISLKSAKYKKRYEAKSKMTAKRE
jgi:transposase